MGMKSRAGRYSSDIPEFERFYRRAVEHKGGPDALEALLPKQPSRRALQRAPDDRCLAAMTKFVFSAGFVWKVVENKWPGFEAAFGGFDIARNAGLDDLAIDELMADERVIRNRQKIAAVRDNARFILDVAHEHGSFARWLAAWPEDDVVGLWQELNARGSRLGGFTGPVVLRHLGVDTFMLTADVVRALVGARVVSKQPTSQRDRAAVQQAFNQWRHETGRPLCQLSKILACSVG